MKAIRKPAANCAKSNIKTIHSTKVPMKDIPVQHGNEHHVHMFHSLMEHHTKIPWNMMKKSQMTPTKYREHKKVIIVVKSTFNTSSVSRNSVKP
mmetsp:Transcript_5274/g.7386  ORF Transcript_5274/g.7386 Transcript_5274/m.7386 type:complete len:94 (+) Transcript_5274:793-1074(+)